MRFGFVCDPSLPMGAWLLRVSRGSAQVDVWHGDGVDVFDDAFFVGAWEGDYAKADPLHARHRFGSGAALHGDGVALLSPSHPYDSIFVVVDDQHVVASNTPVFLLHELRAAPRVRRTMYYRRLHAAAMAPERDDTIPYGGARVRPLRCDKFIVTPDLAVRRDRARPDVPFHDFASYRDLLTSVVASTAENATTGDRPRPYTLCATMSGGYDSPAGAAVGHLAGWRTAVTLVRGPADPDDGTPIGDALGYTTHRVPFERFHEIGGYPEAEFLACNGPDSMIGLAAAEPEIGRSILITGQCGDLAWDRGVHELGHHLERISPVAATGAMHEWAARTGAVQLPVPWIGVPNLDALRRLGASSEMDPYWLGRTYDRAIPRRLLEEMGVPRELFGVEKHAGSHVFAPRGLSEASRRDYEDWLADHKMPVVQAATDAKATAIFHISRLRGHTMSQLANGRMRWRGGHVHHWAVERTRARYGEPRLVA